MDHIVNMANKAATDLSGKDGYCAEYDTTGIDSCDAITDQVIGVITKGGDATELISEVCVFGECRAIAGGTVTAGKYVTSHTDGTVIDSAGAACQEFALALESGVAGDWVRIFVLGSIKTHS